MRCSAVHSCIQGHTVADFKFEGHFKNMVKSINYVSFLDCQLLYYKSIYLAFSKTTPSSDVLHKI